jgi:hypothetical protein
LEDTSFVYVFVPLLPVLLDLRILEFHRDLIYCTHVYHEGGFSSPLLIDFGMLLKGVILEMRDKGLPQLQ